MFSSRKILSWVYLAFAVAGAILPTLANIDFVKSYGNAFDLGQFIALANINPAARSLSSDLFVGATAVIIWIIVESYRLKMRNLWIIILSTVLISFAFAAPMFLCLRERRLVEIESNSIGKIPN